MESVARHAEVREWLIGKDYSTMGPVFDLQPDRMAQERAKQLLTVAETRFRTEAERAAFRAEYTAGAKGAYSSSR
jgi:hypothetical protein